MGMTLSQALEIFFLLLLVIKSSKGRDFPPFQNAMRVKKGQKFILKRAKRGETAKGAPQYSPRRFFWQARKDAALVVVVVEDAVGVVFGLFAELLLGMESWRHLELAKDAARAYSSSAKCRYIERKAA